MGHAGLEVDFLLPPVMGGRLNLLQGATMPHFGLLSFLDAGEGWKSASMGQPSPLWIGRSDCDLQLVSLDFPFKEVEFQVAG
jgi:hypothetical protein